MLCFCCIPYGNLIRYVITLGSGGKSGFFFAFPLVIGLDI